jgi:hypothetical protein
VTSRRPAKTLGGKRKERQAREREQHGKSYEETNWAIKLSPKFREVHNYLRMMQGEPPLPPPEIDLHLPPKPAEKIEQFDPTDPEFMQTKREFEGPLPNDSEHTRWDTWDDVPDEFKEWARANARRGELDAAKKQTKKQLGRLTVHDEFFVLIRKIYDAYMADLDPSAQPKTKAAAIKQMVKVLNPEPKDPDDQSAHDKWVENNELIRRTVYGGLKPSQRSRGKAFDNRVGPPLDERGAKEWFETLQFSRRMRRKRRRTRR